MSAAPFAEAIVALKEASLAAHDSSSALQVQRRFGALSAEQASPSYRRLLEVGRELGLVKVTWPAVNGLRQQLLRTRDGFEIAPAGEEDLPRLQWASGEATPGLIGAPMGALATQGWLALRGLGASLDLQAQLVPHLEQGDLNAHQEQTLVSLLVDKGQLPPEAPVFAELGWIVHRAPNADEQLWKATARQTEGPRGLYLLAAAVACRGRVVRQGQFGFVSGKDEEALVETWRRATGSLSWAQPAGEALVGWLDDPQQAEINLRTALRQARQALLGALSRRLEQEAQTGRAAVERLNLELDRLRVLPGLERALPSLVGGAPAPQLPRVWCGGEGGHAWAALAGEESLVLQSWAEPGWSPETTTLGQLRTAIGEQAPTPSSPERSEDAARRRAGLVSWCRSQWSRLGSAPGPEPELVQLVEALCALRPALEGLGLEFRDPEALRPAFGPEQQAGARLPQALLLPTLLPGDGSPAIEGVGWSLLPEVPPARRLLRPLLCTDRSLWGPLEDPARWLPGATSPAFPCPEIAAALLQRVTLPDFKREGAVKVAFPLDGLPELAAAARAPELPALLLPLAEIGVDVLPSSELPADAIGVFLCAEEGQDELQWEALPLRLPGLSPAPGRLRLLVRGLAALAALIPSPSLSSEERAVLVSLAAELASTFPGHRELSATLSERLTGMRPLEIPLELSGLLPQSVAAGMSARLAGLGRALSAVGAQDPSGPEERIPVPLVQGQRTVAAGLRLPGRVRLPRILLVERTESVDPRAEPLYRLLSALDTALPCLLGLPTRAFPDERVEGGWSKARAERMAELGQARAEVTRRLRAALEGPSEAGPVPGVVALYALALDLMRMGTLWWGMADDEATAAPFVQGAQQIAGALQSLAVLGGAHGLVPWPQHEEGENERAKAELLSAGDGGSTATVDVRPRDPFVAVGGTLWFAVGSREGRDPEPVFFLPRVEDRPLAGAMAVPPDGDVTRTREVHLKQILGIDAENRIALNLRHILCKRLQLPRRERLKRRVLQRIEMLNAVWLTRGRFEAMRQELLAALARDGVRIVGDVTPAGVNELRIRHQIDVVIRPIDPAYRARTVGGAGWLLVSRPRCEYAKDGELIQRMEVWMVQ